MTIQTSHLKELTTLLEYIDIPSSDGTEYSLGEESAQAVAEEVLDSYLIVRKDELPEAKIEGGTVYVGNQAISTQSKADDLLLRALSYLAAAAKLTLIEEERKAEEKRERDEILAAFNSIALSKRSTWGELTANEQLAGKEIVRLRGLQKSFI